MTYILAIIWLEIRYKQNMNESMEHYCYNFSGVHQNKQCQQKLIRDMSFFMANVYFKLCFSKLKKPTLIFITIKSLNLSTLPLYTCPTPQLWRDPYTYTSLCPFTLVEHCLYPSSFMLSKTLLTIANTIHTSEYRKIRNDMWF